MRTLIGITAVAVIVAIVWSNLPTQAKQQFDSVSIDPSAMTGTVTNLLPEVHYDHGFIFPEQQ
jgi:hypothetical protein